MQGWSAIEHRPNKIKTGGCLLDMVISKSLITLARAVLVILGVEACRLVLKTAKQVRNERQ